jgi:mRNA-degrading endonuclease RelE of RelBE toxin-antitoxin system
MADAFEVRYAREAADDIRGLRAFDRQRLISAIPQFLTVAPTTVSRSRIKRLTQPFWSQFRLRVDDFRVYYDVDEATRVVNVLRVLLKGGAQTPKENP